MLVLFWLFATLVVYTYVGYPLAIWALAKIAPTRRSGSPASDTTTVSVIVAVYNERDRIERKLANLRGLEFPRKRLQWVFASDGSTDGTNEILRRHADVDRVECPRGGKAAAINAAAQRATGDVLVFTDVRQELAADAIAHLVRALAEPDVGAVSGELSHRDAATGAGKSIGLYWRYERFIRTSESDFFSCVGASGALYAIRRCDFRPLRPGTILDDFEIPMATVRRGRRIVIERRAQVFDDLETDLPGERRRKVRTLTGNFQTFANNPWLFSPWQNPVWWQFLSHKVARLLVPYALAGTLLTSLLLGGSLFNAFALCQIGFYAVGLLALTSVRVRRSKAASLAGLFVDTNAAAVEALWRFTRDDIESVWVTETSRHAPLD